MSSCECLHPLTKNLIGSLITKIKFRSEIRTSTPHVCYARFPKLIPSISRAPSSSGPRLRMRVRAKLYGSAR